MQAYTSIASLAFALLLCATSASAGNKPPKVKPPPKAKYQPPPPPGPWYPPLSGGATCPLALTQWITRQDLNGQQLQAATNADSTFNGTGIFPSVSLARVKFAPCGVRTMHLHQNVDELLYVLSGTVGASTAFANGAICEQTILKAGDSFMYPRNLIHSARNPSCTEEAVVLGFFTAFNSATVNAAASAFNMPGGPFAPYAAAGQVESIKAASGASTLSFDPLCLARCNLGAKGGQNPVTSLPA